MFSLRLCYLTAVHQLRGGLSFPAVLWATTNFSSQDTFPILYASYKIWPLASIVNFAFIPVEKRIVFLSAVGLVWGVFLSLTAAKQ